MHAPVFSTNMGDTLCIDRYVGSDGRFRFVDGGSCAPEETPEAQRNTENTRRALTFVREHPLDELRLVGLRAWHTYERDDDGIISVEGGTANRFLGARLRDGLRFVANTYFFIVLALAAVGVVLVVMALTPARLFVVLATATLVGIPLILWGTTRFHLPVEPYLALFAAAAVDLTARRRRAWA
jgi:hypothetical protein